MFTHLQTSVRLCIPRYQEKRIIRPIRTGRIHMTKARYEQINSVITTYTCIRTRIFDNSDVHNQYASYFHQRQQSRFGDKLQIICIVCPQKGTEVLKA